MANDTPAPRTVLNDGLWHANPATVQLLGLCPLLAVSNTAVNALGLGLATVLALTVSNTLIALLRRWTPDTVRLPLSVLAIAATVTAIELAMHAWLPALHRVLGLFIPLIVTNCVILARAEAFARRHRPALAALDGLSMGAGFLAALLLLGGLREALGQGTLFAGAGALLGLPWLEWGQTGRHGLLLALLPPGGFLLLALLVAAQRRLSARQTRPTSTTPASDSIPQP